MAIKRPNCLAEELALVVLDASVVINLIATKCCTDIMRSIPSRFGVTDAVLAEINVGRSRGRTEYGDLENLIADGSVERLQLNGISCDYYEDMVSGSASQTLDDGEASSIAYVAAYGGMAAIDERKAMRICKEKYSNVRLISTVDLLANPNVFANLGRERLSNAVGNALSSARMRVLEAGLDWVIDMVGRDCLASYPSLPRSARLR